MGHHHHLIITRNKEMPCLNCRLIEMGEMACYQDRCPQCGRVPPSKKGLPPEKISQILASMPPRQSYRHRSSFPRHSAHTLSQSAADHLQNNPLDGFGEAGNPRHTVRMEGGSDHL